LKAFAVESENSFPVQLWHDGQKVGAPIGPGETSHPYSEPGQYQARRVEEPTPDEILLQINVSRVTASGTPDKTYEITRTNGNFGVTFRFA